MANALASLVQLYTVNSMYLPHRYDEKRRMRKSKSGKEKRQHVVLRETPIPLNL